MASRYVLSEAIPSDAYAIAALFALSWTSPFTQLQFGNVGTKSLSAAMAPQIADHMQNPNISFVVVRNLEAQQVVSVAQWTVSRIDDDKETEESDEEKEERQHVEDELYRKKLPEHSNKDLVMEFTVGLRELRERALGGRQTYLLENIATHPDYRRKGFASQLIKWVFPHADDKSFLVYLDTASDNDAMRLYEKLGFQICGSYTIEDLSKYGGKGNETHVAMVRYPNNDSPHNV